MKKLPPHWANTTLENVLEKIVGGGTPSKANQSFFRGSIPFMTVKDMHTRFPLDTIDHISAEAILGSATTLVPADTLIIATRMSLGKIARPKVSTAINQDLKALFLARGIHKTYIEYFWRSKASHIQELGTGTTVKGIRLDDIRGLSLMLAPLSEQTRIANKLDTVLAHVDACRERLDRIPLILKRFRQSVLAAATSGDLTADWRANQAALLVQIDCVSKAPTTTGNSVLLKILEQKAQWISNNPEHNEVSRVKKRVAMFSAKSSRAEGLPNEWCWAKLEDASLLVVDCHNKTAPYEDRGIALIRTTNIRDGRFIWDDLRFVSADTHRYWSKRCIPLAGDLVFTREAPMGEAAIIPNEKQLCLGQRTMLIRPLDQCVPAKYLLIAMLDPKFKERSQKLAVGTGVKHFRVGDVSDLFLPLPPTAEQNEIIHRVDTLFAFANRLESRLSTARTSTDRLTPALLAKAFRGELVRQDPNDEPASELLKRLAANRAAAPK